jgi:hypothetical protein
MQFKNIARTLVCVSLALAAHSAFAGLSASACDGKLCSNYAAGGGKVTVTVEDLSRVAYEHVDITVAQCASDTSPTCTTVGEQIISTLAGGEKLAFTFNAPPTNWYLITIRAASPAALIRYPRFLVQP